MVRRKLLFCKHKNDFLQGTRDALARLDLVTSNTSDNTVSPFQAALWRDVTPKVNPVTSPNRTARNHRDLQYSATIRKKELVY